MSLPGRGCGRGHGAHLLDLHPAGCGDTTSCTVFAERTHHVLSAVWTPTSSAA
ncbi:hypothetical protein OG883_43905 [Streptomyces sp. NBC_01142]|uniref:hypothetical protein n=1 Tax=Streptomyces sp. NBC_01142 TaxID=2975865 RepID=UPI00225B029F|nr:hypothetical protein [Streptomyces sp. NBC_01142]MCX4826587.1 hypothetical protein [Streptomyces sp. NBC_01142]